MAQRGKKREAGLWLWCFLSAFFVLLFCSKCSFIYPFQDGFDANCFFTVGKSLVRGKVLYRDIYEHKGLYWYLLYSLAYLISHVTFMGAFILEVMAGTLTMYLTVRIVRLFLPDSSFFYLPLVAAVLYSGDAFSYGGQVEEIVLPILLWALYTFLDFRLRQKNVQLALWKVFVCGILTAVLFWMKYTLTGMFLGLTIFMVVLCIREKEYAYLFRCAGAFLGGFFLGSLPAVIYFTVTDSWKDLWEVYFYNMIFRYNTKDIGMSRVEYSLRKVLLTFWRNKRFSLLIVLGVLSFLWQKKDKVDVVTKAGLVFLCLITTVCIFYSKQYNRYWGLALGAFAPLGIPPVYSLCVWLWHRFGREKKLPRAFLPVAGGLSLAGAIGICLLFGTNTYLLKYKQEELPQYRFRDLIRSEMGEKEVKILNYGGLDLGLYTVLDVVPDCKYFTECNIDLPELFETQDRYVIEGRGDYIVTMDQLDIGLDRYEMALEAESELEYPNYVQSYFLYRRIREE